MTGKWFAASLTMLLLVGLFLVAKFTPDTMYGAIPEETPEEAEAREEDENTLVLWYTDEALTEYLSTSAMAFRKEYDVKVIPTLVSGVEYLEYINRTSVDENAEQEKPDLYVTTHDNLLKAYLAGLAMPVIDDKGLLLPGNYPQTSLNAVSVYDHYVAYPLYYETNFFLYNKTYMASIAQSRIEENAVMEGAEGSTAEGADGSTAEGVDENAPDDGSKSQDSQDNASDGNSENAEQNRAAEDGGNGLSEISDVGMAGDNYGGTPMGEEDALASEDVLAQLATMIPATLDDIQTFANNYDAPEAVESVFKWDVSDIFYNYFFVGNYMEVGGEAGDNPAIFNIYNNQAVECLQVYQNMNQFFSIDANEVSYESILNDFIEGKTVFTVATTDAIAKIEEAKAAGDFEFEYGVTVLPDLSSLLKARGLSVTTAVAVNGYSDKQEKADAFAEFLSFYRADEIYDKCGKIACRKNVSYDEPEIGNVMMEYEKSVPIPKMVEASNYWVQLEIAFTKIWKGADPDETLRALSDTIGAQIEEISAKLSLQQSFSAGAGNFVK